MKRSTILLLAVALAAASSRAVVPSLGVKGGLNASKFTGSAAAGSQTHSDLVAGVFVGIGLLRGLTVQPELLYSIKGEENKGTVYGYDAAFVQRFSYIEVPVLLKYSFGSGIVPSIYAGPAVSVLLSAESEFSYNGTSAAVDLVGYFQSTDVCLVVGAEIKLPIRLSLEARYTRGLSSIGKETTLWGVTYAAPDIKNSTISLMAGYYFF
ncbi:PorT family protein [bacterium]|nr:PorT family protein [bacterium]